MLIAAASFGHLWRDIYQLERVQEPEEEHRIGSSHSRRGQQSTRDAKDVSVFKAMLASAKWPPQC